MSLVRKHPAEIESVEQVPPTGCYKRAERKEMSSIFSILSTQNTPKGKVLFMFLPGLSRQVCSLHSPLPSIEVWIAQVLNSSSKSDLFDIIAKIRMEINSCRIDSMFFCIWAVNECFMLEDVNRKMPLPLHPTQLLWFENHMVELVQIPVLYPFFLSIQRCIWYKPHS